MSYPSENTGNYASGIKMPLQNNYETAFIEAVEEFQKKDINRICINADIRKSEGEKNELIIPFLNRKLIVTYPEVNILFNDFSEVTMWLKILLLHYLNCAEGSPATGKYITFKEISGGLSYYPTFQKRTVIPLIKAFSNNFNSFIKSSVHLGGKLSDFGKYSILFQVFPKVDIIFNMQEGDDEFPPDGNIIFDSSITNYLPSEDIVVLCNMLSVMIIKNKTGT